MFRKVTLALNACALTLVVACSGDTVPTQDEIAAKARDRGFTVIEDTWVDSGTGHGVSVVVGDCTGNFYINNDDSILVEVFSADGIFIGFVGDMHVDVVLRTSPTNACAPE